MNMSYVVSGLLAKRRELAGIIELKKKEINILKNQVEALDTALLVFDSNIDLRELGIKKAYKKNKLFSHGEMSKLLLEILRSATEGMNLRQISTRIMDIKSIDDSNKNGIKAHISSGLNYLKKTGKVTQIGHNYQIGD